VAIADINADAGDKAVKSINASRSAADAQLLIADVSRTSECQRVVRETIVRFGGIDVLFDMSAVRR
jgi:NAD(P)-dependent dehydrogenase (short-subunit alcohol dehydrogenase family)